MTDQLIPGRRAFPADDPIFALNAEAQARRARGESILNATVGALLDDEGQLVILRTVTELWKELGPMEVAPYAPIAGDPAFLQALVQRHWPGLGPGAACATPGGSGALTLALRNFLEPGQRVLTTAPFWGPYTTMAAESGLAVATAPWPGPGEPLDGGVWDRTIRGLLRDQGRLLLLLNDPCHNPTGRNLGPQDRQVLADILREASVLGPITLILDLAYLDYTPDPARVSEALAHYATLGAEGRILVGAALSLSKSMTLYGARCGALAFPWCGDPRLQAALAQSCRGTWSNCARAPQSLLLRLAGDGAAQARLAEEHRHWAGVLASRAAALDEALAAAGMVPLRWTGGFFVMIPVAQAEGVGARLRGEGIFTVPLPEGLRVGLCGMRSDMAPRLVEGLKRALA